MKKKSRFLLRALPPLLLGASSLTLLGADYGTGLDTLSAGDRQVLEGEANERGAHVHVPPGQTLDDAAQLWHLSEGADVIPLKWFRNIESTTSTKPGSYLSDDLEGKFGMIKESNQFASAHNYPTKYIGLTTAWSDEKPTQADVHLQPGQSMVDIDHSRVLPNGTHSIPMVGTNCAFCHTSQITVNGKTVLHDGEPGMIHIRGFFKDFAASTTQTMLDKGMLAKYLRKINYQPASDIDGIAASFSSEFKRKLGLQSVGGEILNKLLTWLNRDGVQGQLKDKLVKDLVAAKVQKAMFEHRDVTQEYLLKFLKLSYPDMDPNPTMTARMTWLARLIGDDPKLKITPEGYARTDAWGRISNNSVRLKHPVDLDATLKVPPLVHLHNEAMNHYAGNVAGPGTRNAGQAIGLGAVITDPKTFASTINLDNIAKLEKQLYKIKTPNWEGDFGKIDAAGTDQAMKGCATYQKTCAKCHQTEERAGPTKELINDKMIPLAVVGTDPNMIRNQLLKVDGKPFSQALFATVQNLRRAYYKEHKIDADTQCEWEQRDIRGENFVRDTFLGVKDIFPPGSGLEYLNVKAGAGYPARQLSGVWASAPYLHNGSVPSIEDLLKPSSERPKKFLLGSTDYNADKLGYNNEVSKFPFTEFEKTQIEALKFAEDMKDQRNRNRRIAGLAPLPPKLTEDEIKMNFICDSEKYQHRCFDSTKAGSGNSNKGHEGAIFGTDLSPDEKKDLLVFMKILRPDAEYSWDTQVRYRVNADKTCTAMN